MNVLMRIKRRYQSMTMQLKMFLTYSFFLSTAIIVILLLFLPIYASYYRKQLNFSVHQSTDQAGSYIQNSLENMVYVSKLLSSDKNINLILSQDGFGEARTLKEEYKEFFALRDILGEIEVTSKTYQVGFYVSDDVVYAGNRRHFYPLSDLEGMEDYDRIAKRLEKESFVGVFSSENLKAVSAYVLLNQIPIRKKDGTERNVISRVALPVTEFETILKKSNSAEQGLVWLVDPKGVCVSASSMERYRKIEELRNISKWFQKQTETYRIGGEELHIFRKNIPGYGWQLYSLVPETVVRRQIRFIQYLMIVIILSITFIVAAISYGLSCYYVKKLSDLNKRIYGLLGQDGSMNLRLLQEVEGGASVSKSGLEKEKKDEVDELYASFFCMTQRLNYALLEQYRLGKNVKNAELRALQAQINPHFLYNTLDIINWGAMAHGAFDVAEIATNLGAFYRLSLNKGKSVLKISEELDHVRAYVNIENVHFDGKIGFAVDVPEELMEYGCLNIILQPFVENAIVHGIAEHPEIHEMQIYISATREGNDIHFLVEDNGSGMPAEQVALLNHLEDKPHQNGYGINNINFRMRLCFGEKYHARFESVQGEGTTVHILLPALSLEELEQQVE